MRKPAEAQPAPTRCVAPTLPVQIPYYSVSGIQIRYLKVIERSGYQALPWWVQGEW